MSGEIYHNGAWYNRDGSPLPIMWPIIPTVLAGNSYSFYLGEGGQITVTGYPGTIGVIEQISAVDVVEVTWVVGAIKLAPIGPFSGSHKYRITCTAGSIDATVGDAVLSITPAATTRVKWGPLFAANMNAAIAQVNSNGGGYVVVDPAPAGQVHVVERQINMIGVSNVAVVLPAGAVLQRPAQFTLTCTITSGSNIVTVTDGETSNILVDVPYDSQGANSMYIGGTGIPMATRVQTVGDRTTFTMTNTATVSGSVTLTFHYAHCIFRRQDSSNTAIVCPDGWAKLDGNYGVGLVTGDSADYFRNAITTIRCTDVYTSGLHYYNNYYHGEIGLGINKRIFFGRMKATFNGFRGIHYHGALLGSVEVFDMASVYLEGNGTMARYFDGGARTNTGLYVMFEDVKSVHIGSVIAKDEIGFAIDCNGRGGGDSLTIPLNRNINIDSIVTQDCGIGMGHGGSRTTTVGNLKMLGSRMSAYGAQAPTLGTPTANLPLLSSSNGLPLSNIYQGSLVFPAGLDLTLVRPGHFVNIPLATGGTVKLAIWSVDVPSRTVVVFNENTPTALPWAVGDNGTVKDVQIMTAGEGVFLSGAVPDNVTESLVFGSVVADSLFRAFYSSPVSAGTYDITQLKIGSFTGIRCMKGFTMQNVTDFWIGSLSMTETGDQYNGVSHADTANFGVYLDNNNIGRIDHLHSVSVGSGNFNRNGAVEVKFTSGNSNITVGKATIGTTNNNSPVDFQGTNIVIGDPRTPAGARIRFNHGTGTLLTYNHYELPTLSGFGTGATVVSVNGGKAFKVTVGTSPSTTGTITFPTSDNGWVVSVRNITSGATLYVEQSAFTTTSATVTSYNRTTGVATAFSAGDVLLCTADLL